MDDSATYLILLMMIQQGLLIMALPELVKSLMFFEDQGLITTDEHKALIEIAMKSKVSDGSKKVL